MAATHLKISPFYLPWHQQGVEFLLQEVPVPPQQSLCHASAKPAPPQRMGQQQGRPAATPPKWKGQQQAQQQAQQAQQQGQRQDSQQASQQFTPQTTPQASRTLAGTHTQTLATSQASSASAPNVAPNTAQNTGQNTAQNRLFLPFEQWPAPWQERFQQTKAARVVWTYGNLGHDLCGEASPERRTLLRTILTELGHPPGTHCFWPMSLPSSEDPSTLIPNVPVFWSGVRLFEARVLIILGEEAATSLGYKVYDMPFKEFRKQDKLVILAKDMEVLIEKPHMRSLLLQYLRPHLRQYLQLS